jgi:hypothetical protein
MLVILFISFKLREASSSDYPPERKTTPVKAGTIDLERVLTVIQAISAGFFLSAQSEPYVTMFGLSKHPSKMSLCSIKAF